MPAMDWDQAYDRAVRLLARKARTEVEVRADLCEGGCTGATVDAVIDRLKSHRHLDDVELAHDQAAALIDGKHLAPAAAVQTLEVRGIAAALAREAVAHTVDGRTELELCRRAAEALPHPSAMDSRSSARRVRALARLGYAAEVIEASVRRDDGDTRGSHREVGGIAPAGEFQ